LAWLTLAAVIVYRMTILADMAVCGRDPPDTGSAAQTL